MGHVFISYAREDRANVSALAAALEQHGVSVWMDARLTPGDHFDVAIEEALAAADKVLVAWSQSSFASRWVRAEAGDGLERGILVPVLLEVTSIPLEFRRVQTVDMTNWNQDTHSDTFKLLLRALAPKTEIPPGPRRSPAPSQKRRVKEAVSTEQSAKGTSPCDDPVTLLTVGKGGAFYLHSWERMQVNKTSVSWNWAAFFSVLLGGACWPAYRKMWGLAGVMLLWHFVLTSATPEVGIPKVDLVLESILWFSIALAFGVYGNALYRAHITSLIGRALRSPDFESQVKRRGGVSPAGLIAVTILHALVFISINYKDIKASDVATDLSNGFSDGFNAASE